MLNLGLNIKEWTVIEHNLSDSKLDKIKLDIKRVRPKKLEVKPCKYPPKKAPTTLLSPEVILTHEQITERFVNHIQKIGHFIPNQTVIFEDGNVGLYAFDEKTLYIRKIKNKYRYIDLLLWALSHWEQPTSEEEQKFLFDLYKYHFGKEKMKWL